MTDHKRTTASTAQMRQYADEHVELEGTFGSSGRMVDTLRSAADQLDTATAALQAMTRKYEVVGAGMIDSDLQRFEMREERDALRKELEACRKERDHLMQDDGLREAENDKLRAGLAQAKAAPVSKGEYEVVIPCIDARDACACIENLKESNPASSEGAYMRAKAAPGLVVTLPQRLDWSGAHGMNPEKDGEYVSYREVIAAIVTAGGSVKHA